MLDLCIVFISTAVFQGCSLTHQYCGPCTPFENITVLPNTIVSLSQCWGDDKSLSSQSGSGSAVLTIPDGTNDVTIHGPGIVKSNTWPLKPGANLFIDNDVVLMTDEFPGMAIEIVASGTLHINDVETDAFGLVSVHSQNYRKLTLEGTPLIKGKAKKVLAGFGHVVTPKKKTRVDVACDSKSPQMIVKQELITDGFTFSDTALQTCTVVDLYQLLGVYGAEYEIELFPSPPAKRHITWRYATYSSIYAGFALAVLFLAFQPDLLRFWYTVRQSKIKHE